MTLRELATPTLPGSHMFTKILVVYSTVLTTLLAAFTLAGSAAARGQDRVQRFDEIDVHRINVREPDGTLRMVISNHARLPSVIVRDKKNPPWIGHMRACCSMTTKGPRTAVSYSVDTPKRTAR